MTQGKQTRGMRRGEEQGEMKAREQRGRVPESTNFFDLQLGDLRAPALNAGSQALISV